MMIRWTGLAPWEFNPLFYVALHLPPVSEVPTAQGSGFRNAAPPFHVESSPRIPRPAQGGTLPPPLPCTFGWETEVATQRATMRF